MRASALLLALAVSFLLVACGTDESPTPPAKSTAGMSTVNPTPTDAPPVSKAPVPEPVVTDWRDIPWISPLPGRIVQDGQAPIPFFAHEISNALVVGLRWVKRESTFRPPPAIVEREVVAVDSEGYTVRLSWRDAQGRTDPESAMENKTQWSAVKPPFVGPAPERHDSARADHGAPPAPSIASATTPVTQRAPGRAARSGMHERCPSLRSSTSFAGARSRRRPS